MNQAMEMLRNKAAQMWNDIVGSENITLQVDAVEEPVKECPTATMTVSKMTNPELSQALTDGANLHTDLCINQLNLFDILGRPEKVWIYNVSRQAYNLSNALIRRLHVQECAEGEEYAVVTSLPLVVVQPRPNVENGDTEYLFIDGRRVAMDLINPSNLGLDQDTKTGVWSYAIGNDFSKRGVFFSVHNPPLKKEVKAARKRLKDYYIDVIEKANIIRITSAAERLGLPTSEVAAAVNFVEGPRTTR